MRFDRIVMVDWSASSVPSPKRPSADAIWVADAAGGQVDTQYHRTRAEAHTAIEALIAQARARGERVLAGFDFAFGYPAGFGDVLTGSPDPLAIWDWLAARIEDGPDNANNRFAVAGAINARFPGVGPFWGRPEALQIDGLPAKGSVRQGQRLPERRAVEQAASGAQSVWKLYTTGAVGSQVLMGLPYLARLRTRFGADLAVWPFETRDADIVLAEIWPSLLREEVAHRLALEPGAIKDEVQVRLLAQALARLSEEGALARLTRVPDAARSEGWILGVGHEAALRAAARPRLAPPVFADNCFALPPGVNWLPVDAALAHLRGAMVPLRAEEVCAVPAALGRVLAREAVALRSNPPTANAAVDGYGFAHAQTGEGAQVLPLLPGRSAAGVPYRGAVPAGSALRILTGAALPEGVDTVVLEEDCTVAQGHVAFAGPVKPRANTRRAGEDVQAGAVALQGGRRLRPPDLALLTGLGLQAVAVRPRLRVGVLSTGDELADPGESDDVARTYDANRPMLLSLAEGWGYAPVDLGRVRDDRDAVRARLDAAAAQADVIVTSGGASAGDEDHMSAILRDEGSLAAWRIALKPGRPLALGLWRGVPVFGLPGNPVAALVCALIFARPALSAMAGAGWSEAPAFQVPAAFAKSKKPGRREYLRARLNEAGAAEVFASEGSGRISGLSWAEGLVELPDGALEVAPGTPVRFLPYAGLFAP